MHGKTFADRIEFISKGVEFYGGENMRYSYMYSKDVEMSMLAESACKLAHKLVFDQWHNSLCHRANMLNQSYKILGAARFE
jgi:uncharacterized protein YkwD